MKHIPATIAALLLTVAIAGIATAQDSTTLGRWVQSQPSHVQKRIGCDLRPPYSRYCWEHVTVDGRIVGTIHYRQNVGNISVTRTRGR